MIDRLKEKKSHKYYINEKNEKINRIIHLAKLITAEGGGNIRFKLANDDKGSEKK